MLVALDRHPRPVRNERRRNETGKVIYNLYPVHTLQKQSFSPSLGSLR